MRKRKYLISLFFILVVLILIQGISYSLKKNDLIRIEKENKILSSKNNSNNKKSESLEEGLKDLKLDGLDMINAEKDGDNWIVNLNYNGDNKRFIRYLDYFQSKNYNLEDCFVKSQCNGGKKDINSNIKLRTK